MALITDATLQLIKGQLEARNNKLRAFAELYAETTWDAVQIDAKTLTVEQLLTKYPIGTEMVTHYTVDGNTYDMPWVVVAIRPVVKQDGNEHNGIILQMKYASVEDIQFDAAEHEEATEETALDGWYYCGLSGTTYTMLNLATGDAVPYSSYDHVYHGSVNDARAYQYGYNRYKFSAMRQWLNSAGDVGEWWESQHNGDTAPSQLATRKGFMAGLDADFRAVIDPVKIQVATNTVTDSGVTDVMYDKFFLPSIEEIYGAPQAAGVEGAYWPYWKTITGLSEPSNSANNARKTPRLSSPTGSAVYLWLRSATRGYLVEWVVGTGGNLYNGSAPNSYGAQAACVIS